MDQIRGYLERLTYQNPENGYTVAQIKVPSMKDLVCVVGSMPLAQPGETLRCLGEWKQHLVYGRQFLVKEYHVETPADIEGIRRYLGSGLIKGIGPTYAKRIVDAFGVDTLDVIDSTPEKLHDIPGIGKKRVAVIKRCWEEQKTIREVMIFLQSCGITPGFAQKIFKKYGTESIEVVKSNPYLLAYELTGVGFRMADNLAHKLGIEKESPLRIQAGVDFALMQLSNEGHVCYPLEPFLREAAKILEVSEEKVTEQIPPLINEEKVIVEEILIEGTHQRCIWARPQFLAEKGIAVESQRLLQGTTSLRDVQIEKALEWAEEKLSIELAPLQKEAIAAALSKKMLIITGGPGTGKSTITNVILAITEKLSPNILLAAPTGRAAKRMSEITGRKAHTIHSLLEVNFVGGGFKRGRDNPLKCDLLIIDEASMIDTYLMNHLLKAIPTHARVIFVGDIYQLPSVGPGNVLRDLIATGQFAVTTLNQIFRQAEGSRIVTNAHRINNGVFPDLRNLSDSDFYFVEAEEKEQAMQEILSLVAVRLPKRYGFDPFEDIQVLAPMKRGEIGTENLNVVLQKQLNPSDDSFFHLGRQFHKGDRVMQLRNNYQKEVYNGDIGRITSIDKVNQQVIVRYDERDVEYDLSDLDEVTLAYAVSIHKFQGSECPCVVIPVHTTHFKMLFRNLLYTGVTRGKRMVILVGTKKAIAIATRNDEVKRRYTGLRYAMNAVMAAARGAL